MTTYISSAAQKKSWIDKQAKRIIKQMFGCHKKRQEE